MILTPAALASLSQHSGVFVLIILFLLMVFALSFFQMAEDVRRALAESKHIAMQVIPKLQATARREILRQFQRQWPVTGTAHVFAELLLVGRENTDAAPPARDCYIPLLCIRRRFDCGIAVSYTHLCC